MGSINKVRVGNDDVYEATEPVAAGDLVVPASGATISGKQGVAVAGAAAVNVLGVASESADTDANLSDSGTGDDGYPVTTVHQVDPLVTVYKGAVVEVTYTAAAVGYGDKIVAAANGEVAAYDSVAPDPVGSIVGECRVVGGMGSGGGKGLALIY